MTFPHRSRARLGALTCALAVAAPVAAISAQARPAPAATATAAAAPAPVPIGAVAPAFSLAAVTRYGPLARPVTSADFLGKTLVIAFFYRARTKG